MSKHEILVVDDEELVHCAFDLAFRNSSVRVHSVKTGRVAIELVRNDPYRFCAAYVDQNLQFMKGHEVVKALKEINRDLDVRIISGDNSEEAINHFLSAEVDGYYIKSVDFESKLIPDLQGIRRRFDETRRLSNCTFQADDTGFIGRSIAAQKIRGLLKKFALAPESTVLITGENGTGKEICAQAIHRLSPRAKRPFIAVNCAAISPQLIESELFGHKKNAFTDAKTDKVGIFEAAGIGTVFLDEIGDMSMDLQAKLLRVLENREIRPVGSTKSLPIAARIIAATNTDIKKAVELKKFRKDLFYRLNILNIEIPPLRERVEDIEDYIALFKVKFEGDRKVAVLHSAVERFKNYPWPGNVRELRGTLERLFVEAGEIDRIEPKHLESKFFTEEVRTNFDSCESLKELEDRYDQRRQEIIMQTLTKTNGNQREAARILDCSEAHIRKHKVSASAFN